MTTMSYLEMGETHRVVFFYSVRCILFVVMSEMMAFCYQINLTVCDMSVARFPSQGKHIFLKFAEYLGVFSIKWLKGIDCFCWRNGSIGNIL